MAIVTNANIYPTKGVPKPTETLTQLQINKQGITNLISLVNRNRQALKEAGFTDEQIDQMIENIRTFGEKSLGALDEYFDKNGNKIDAKQLGNILLGKADIVIVGEVGEEEAPATLSEFEFGIVQKFGPEKSKNILTKYRALKTEEQKAKFKAWWKQFGGIISADHPEDVGAALDAIANNKPAPAPKHF